MMKINSHHNFIEGETAKLLKDKLGLEFKVFRNVKIERIDDIKEAKVLKKEGHATYTKGEDEYLMFYYLKRYDVLKYGLPKYHAVECETRRTYSGYVYSNKMPVNIICKSSLDIHNEVILDLCKNCRNEVFRKNLWSFSSGSNKWYDVLLEYVSKQRAPSFKKDGYHSMWKQISEGYREKQKYVCESCNIDLSDKSSREYLHTHHKNGNIRDNREENFEALCILCHALEHRNKLQDSLAFMQLDDFIGRFRSQLDRKKIKEYELIRAI